jgi:hypothetical protein
MGDEHESLSQDQDDEELATTKQDAGAEALGGSLGVEGPEAAAERELEDPELVRLIERWPDLSETLRHAVLRVAGLDPEELR